MKRAIIYAAVLSFCFQSAAYAEQERIKDETVYVNLASDGSIRNTFVVNAFRLNGQNKIIDYGNYENIKNLSGTAKPEVNNGYIKFDVEPGTDMFYYQGELKNVNIPWDIRIRYFLDGKEMTGEEIIGKSGNLEIILDARSNPRAQSYFADNYLAQITAVFDTDKFKNINCTDAMTAIIGSNKQLSMMVLPGMDKTYHISANVSEFEMDGISIAMISVSDGITEKLDSLKISIGDMSRGIDQLVDGSGRLKNGADDLSSAISLLNAGTSSVVRVIPSLGSGINELDRGVWSVYSGAKRLSAASADIRSGLGELDSKSIDIIKGVDAISGGLKEMTNKKTAVISGINELNKSKSGIGDISAGIDKLNAGYKEVEDGLIQAASKKGELEAGREELKNADTDISALSGGLDTLKSGIGELSYANSQQSQIINALLAAAAKDPNLAPYAQYIGTLQYISDSVGTGLSDMSEGVDTLSGGVNTAQDGINTLYSAAETFADASILMADASEQLAGGMKKLNSGFGELSGGIGKIDKLFSAANSFADSSLKLIEGAEKIAGGTEELRNGLVEYTRGVNTLAVNYIDFDNGIYELENGALALSGGMSELSAGGDAIISALNEIGDNMDKLDSSAAVLPSAIDSLRMGGNQIIQAVSSPAGSIGNAAEISGDAMPVSFAAPGIVTPNSVQFAIKTPDLHIPDETPEDAQEEKVGFIQKLIGLFKKDKK